MTGLDPLLLKSNQGLDSLNYLPFDLPQTPAFLFDFNLLEDNLAYLKRLKEKAGIKILLAQKAYSLFSSYPLIAQYLDGSTASGLYEARLAKEHFPGEIHVFSPAFTKEDILELRDYVDHVVFNSFEQYLSFKDLLRGRKVSVGLRINPMYSEVETKLYDPAGLDSRLGIMPKDFHLGVKEHGLEGVDGLHFHSLCQQNSPALKNTLVQIEKDFAQYFPQLSWFNFGGGHHLCRKDYDVDLLLETIAQFKAKYDLDLYLEPGEAVALNTGFLIATVRAITPNRFAILDSSASCHMPDVIEMPYTPEVFLLQDSPVLAEIKKDRQAENTYTLAGPSCLAGDQIGTYKFPRELIIGDRLVFLDMAIYAHVKTNTFNGIPLAHLYTYAQKLKLERAFDYQDFKTRLGAKA